jgi:hypothetical protein
MNNLLLKRVKRVLGYLAIAVFLSGGCISLASMEMNPLKWPAVCRPIFVLISFLFFQWLYRDSPASGQNDVIKKLKGFKACKKGDKDKDYYKRME